MFIRQTIQQRARLKIILLKSKGLQIVSVAGSYGKTSTKHILAHTLGQQRNVFVSSKSINTLLGLAQEINVKLTAQHEVFIVELAEFKPGDLKKLLNLTIPDYGVLTPIGHQHIEHFSSFQNVIKEFHTYTDYFSKQKYPLLIAEQNAKLLPPSNFETYGYQKSNNLRVDDCQIKRQGTEYDVNFDGEKIHVFTPLLGKHQALNTLPSFWVAEQLRLGRIPIAKSLSNVPYIPRRHEPHFGENQVLILDNSYNSNPDSAKESLQLLKELPGSKRLIITMGFVELGNDSQHFHNQFGRQLATTVDIVGLIETPNTQFIIDGFLKNGGKQSQIFIGKNQEDVLQKIQPEIISNSIVLFENGFQELYQ